jgi:hypothetical protein
MEDEIIFYTKIIFFRDLRAAKAIQLHSSIEGMRASPTQRLPYLKEI